MVTLMRLFGLYIFYRKTTIYLIFSYIYMSTDVDYYTK